MEAALGLSSLGRRVRREQYLIGILMACVSGLANAAVSHGEVEIDEILTGFDDNRILFSVDEAHINPANCSKPYLYAVDPAKNGEQSALSLLLSAQLNQRKVTIVVREGTCYGSYPVIKYIRIK